MCVYIKSHWREEKDINVREKKTLAHKIHIHIEFKVSVTAFVWVWMRVERVSHSKERWVAADNKRVLSRTTSKQKQKYCKQLHIIRKFRLRKMLFVCTLFHHYHDQSHSFSLLVFVCTRKGEFLCECLLFHGNKKSLCFVM